jgi:hypothetical protein
MNLTVINKPMIRSGDIIINAPGDVHIKADIISTSGNVSIVAREIVNFGARLEAAGTIEFQVTSLDTRSSSIGYIKNVQLHSMK